MQMHISCTMSCCSTLLLPTAIAGRIYTFPFIIDPITVFQNVKMSLCEIIQKIPIRFNFRLDAFSTKCHLLPKAILFFTSYPSDQMYFWLNVIRPNVIRVNVIRPNVIESCWCVHKFDRILSRLWKLYIGYLGVRTFKFSNEMKTKYLLIVNSL